MSNLPLIGERYQNKNGHWFTVVEVNGCLDITVKFDSRDFVRKTKAQYIRNKSVKLPPLFVGDSFKDRLGNSVIVKDIDTAARVTFEWEDGYTRVCRSYVLKNNSLIREEDSGQLNPSIKEGDKFTNQQGSEFHVKKYTKAANIVVEFTSPICYSVKTTMGNIKKGVVHNKYLPTVAGVGIIGDFEVDTKSKMYRTWAGMLKRVYTPRSGQQLRNYGDCSVQNEWFSIENFAEWFSVQNLENDWELDKDLLIKGNRVYSEHACVFLPREINSFLTNRHNHRGDCPVGVTYHPRLNKYQASCTFDGENNYLGVFTDSESAFNCYKNYKESCAKILAVKWEGIIDKRGVEALLAYRVDITD